MTNTTDRYIDNPMPEGLSRRERRGWVSRIPNPDYIEPTAKREAREYREKLMAIPGANYWTKGEKRRIYFNDTEIGGKYSFFNGYYDCNTGEFDGDAANKELGRELVEAFRNKYGV